MVTVTKAERNEKSEKPPSLYDLTSLQRDANRVLGYTAQQTLDYTQNLYEKKLVTYPRTDSRFLTDDMARSLPDIVKLAFHTFPMEGVDNVPVHAEQVVNNKKVTDHHAIHNHIIYNSTSLDASRKFKNFFLSGLAVQRLSDMVCLEHGLSIITPKPYRERQKRTVYPKKRTQRDDLCEAIDAVLKQKPKGFEDFIQALADMGFEFKDGKQPAFKGKDQKRFIRLRSLGDGYSKEELQAVISGKSLHRSRGGSANAPTKNQFQMLIDVQAKMAEGKTVGYEKWAKKFNRKEAARTVILLKEKGLGNYDDLTAHIEKLSARFDELSDSIKAAEKRIVEVQALQQHIKNYRDTRQIYVEYRKSGYSKKFFEEHRQEITIHKAAKQAFDEAQITKLPSKQSLYEEFHRLTVQKKQDYAEYRKIRKEKEELLIAKQTVETILSIDKKKEQEQEKKSVR